MERAYTLEELAPIFDFVGYGNLGGPVWFLGPEEAGDLGTLDNRLAYNPVEDLRDAHITKLGITKHHDVTGKIDLQATWGGMCHVMLGLNGQEPTYAAKVEYQAKQLGQFNDETMLLELLPMPNKNVRSWAYGDLGIAQLQNRRAYYRYLLRKRQERIRELIRVHQPKLIVVYGRTLWHSKLKPIFGDTSFGTTSGFYVGRYGSSLVISCGHFSDSRPGPTNMVKPENLDRLVEAIKDSGYVHPA